MDNAHVFAFTLYNLKRIYYVENRSIEEIWIV